MPSDVISSDALRYNASLLMVFPPMLSLHTHHFGCYSLGCFPFRYIPSDVIPYAALPLRYIPSDDVHYDASPSDASLQMFTPPRICLLALRCTPPNDYSL